MTWIFQFFWKKKVIRNQSISNLIHKRLSSVFLSFHNSYDTTLLKTFSLQFFASVPIRRSNFCLFFFLKMNMHKRIALEQSALFIFRALSTNHVSAALWKLTPSSSSVLCWWCLPPSHSGPACPHFHHSIACQYIVFSNLTEVCVCVCVVGWPWNFRRRQSMTCMSVCGDRSETGTASFHKLSFPALSPTSVLWTAIPAIGQKMAASPHQNAAQPFLLRDFSAFRDFVSFYPWSDDHTNIWMSPHLPDYYSHQPPGFSLASSWTHC